eukprot:CAMPEP_0119570452 /NCGR_PEP_ID=MMETSP1352-20130426/43620_1 /TAXON_ID=265584 /ORGANISM="Stauroneis constricta, Strain CCMP1120" /LENGTH=326 /DNA_ID=CAMNT_0007620121 /DNA_START=109 /DNA_END=1090 /DNA_ORIENTATION=+
MTTATMTTFVTPKREPMALPSLCLPPRKRLRNAHLLHPLDDGSEHHGDGGLHSRNDDDALPASLTLSLDMLGDAAPNQAQPMDWSNPLLNIPKLSLKPRTAQPQSAMSMSMRTSMSMDIRPRFSRRVVAMASPPPSLSLLSPLQRAERPLSQPELPLPSSYSRRAMARLSSSSSITMNTNLNLSMNMNMNASVNVSNHSSSSANASFEESIHSLNDNINSSHQRLVRRQPRQQQQRERQLRGVHPQPQRQHQQQPPTPRAQQPRRLSIKDATRVMEEATYESPEDDAAAAPAPRMPRRLSLTSLSSHGLSDFPELSVSTHSFAGCA